MTMGRRHDGQHSSGIGELGLQLAARVVKGLVEGPRSRVETACEIPRRYIVDRDCDQHLALMRGQVAYDQSRQSPSELVPDAAFMRRFTVRRPHRRPVELEL